MILLISSGNLTKDAITNNVGGKNVINFSVAHNSKFGDKETVTYMDCSWWIEKQNILPYLKKGQQVMISGEPSLRTWESNGKTGATISVRIEKLQLLGGNPQQQPEPEHKAKTLAEAEADNAEPMNDLPF